MTQLPLKRNWGNAIYSEYPELIRQLDSMYSDITNVLLTNVRKRVVESENPPASSQVNKFFQVGDIWVRTGSDTAWIMTSRTNATDATWTQIT